MSTPETIAIVGAGLIGRSWAIVFARAGHPVAMWDADAGAVQTRGVRAVGCCRATVLDSGELDVHHSCIGHQRRVAGETPLPGQVFYEALRGVGYEPWDEAAKPAYSERV